MGGRPAPCPPWLLEVPLAHRGLWSDGVPENSLAAFAAAREAGVGIELDVRLAADGVPVVFHDARLDRLTRARGPLSARNSEELGALALGGSVAVDDTWHDGIPTLADALAVAADAPVMVEVKPDRRSAAVLRAAVAVVLADHDGPTCVASFDPGVLRWLRRTHPAVPRVLTASPSGLARSGRRAISANLAVLGLVDPVALSYDLAGLGLPAVQRVRDRGTPVLAWTVRTPAHLAAARRDADNLIFEHLSTTELAPRP